MARLNISGLNGEAIKGLLNKLKAPRFGKSIPVIINSQIVTVSSVCWDSLFRCVKGINAFLGYLRPKSAFGLLTQGVRNRWRRFRERTSSFREELNRHWGVVLETAIILLIALMPVLNAWESLLILIGCLYLIRLPENKLPNTGLFSFWLALSVSALLAAGMNGVIRLVPLTVWLLIAGLSGRTFSPLLSRRIIKFIVFTSLFWLLIGFWQQWSGVPTPLVWLERQQSLVITVRSYAVFGNPNIYGLYLLSILVFTLTGIASNSQFRVFFWLLLPLVLASLAFTYSRTAWLLGLVLLAAWLKDRVFRHKYLYFAGIILLLLSFPGFRARLVNLTNLYQSTLGFRMQIWKELLRMLPEYWLFGSGPGSFSRVFPNVPAGTGFIQHGHQLYLQLWLENGILSFIAFLRMLSRNLTGFKLRDLTEAVMAIIWIFLLYGFVETWWLNQFGGGYFWLMIGLSQSLRTVQNDS